MAETPEPLQPILAAHLFPELEARLLELLRSLGGDDWDKQTLAPAWKVKDVAAHLLDTALRKLSLVRDGHTPSPPAIRSHDDLVAFINRLNHEGVQVYRRLSPPVLIELMESASGRIVAFHEALDPFAEAAFPVEWAGEEKSLNWFDTARELTERWHHQQQIRLAVGKPGIMTREFYFPVLDCFLRALPFAYRNVRAKPGALARFNVAGECGGSWFLYRHNETWQLVGAPFGDQVSETTIPQEIAWRVFTKGIGPEEARAQVQVAGDAAVGLHILEMIAIIG
ncbi:MAG: maleylpyruvate isomerase N-terminal domain-containing protein [Candidatus Acidiferrales bacterium]